MSSTSEPCVPTCEHCASELSGRQRRFCSRRCRDNSKGKRRYAINPEKSKQTYRAFKAAHPDIVVEYARRKSARRTAVKFGNVTEPYRRTDVYERDRGICQICHQVVDFTLAWPDPGFGSIDHVVPQSAGGPDVFDNVRLAHLSCNQSAYWHGEYSSATVG